MSYAEIIIVCMFLIVLIGYVLYYIFYTRQHIYKEHTDYQEMMLHRTLKNGKKKK
jgi:hypothetical protein